MYNNKSLTHTLLRVAFLFSLLVAMISCDQDKVLPSSEYPSEITSYIAMHFPNNRILQILKDNDGLTKEYEVLLSENINLKFNGKKEAIEIDGTTKLPNSVIPEKILQYVTSHYPDNYITDWELDKRVQQIKLDNNLELEFNKEGDFLKLDN